MVRVVIRLREVFSLVPDDVGAHPLQHTWDIECGKCIVKTSDNCDIPSRHSTTPKIRCEKGFTCLAAVVSPLMFYFSGISTVGNRPSHSSSLVYMPKARISNGKRTWRRRFSRAAGSRDPSRNAEVNRPI